MNFTIFSYYKIHGDLAKFLIIHFCLYLSRNFATLGPFPRLQPPCLTGMISHLRVIRLGSQDQETAAVRLPQVDLVDLQRLGGRLTITFIRGIRLDRWTGEFIGQEVHLATLGSIVSQASYLKVHDI